MGEMYILPSKAFLSHLLDSSRAVQGAGHCHQSARWAMGKVQPHFCHRLTPCPAGQSSGEGERRDCCMVGKEKLFFFAVNLVGALPLWSFCKVEWMSLRYFVELFSRWHCSACIPPLVVFTLCRRCFLSLSPSFFPFPPLSHLLLCIVAAAPNPSVCSACVAAVAGFVMGVATKLYSLTLLSSWLLGYLVRRSWK